MAAEMEKAEEEAKRKKKELEETLKKNQEATDKALKESADALKKAQAAQEAAHKAAEEARKSQEALQIAEHKKLMADRKAKFESNYRNVWATGPTGASMVHMTVENRQLAENLIYKLFQKTLIADVTDYQHGISRRYLKDGKMTFEEQQHSLVMITSDDRVAELIEEVANTPANKTSNPGYFDLVVSPLATGSKEYIKWVKEQTMQVLADAPAFYNQKAETTVKPKTETVEDSKKKDDGDDDDDKKKPEAKKSEEKKDKKPEASKKVQTSTEEESSGDDDEESE